MKEQHMKIALIGLQWTLGIVILVEAILFVMPGAGHEFSRTHMPNAMRLILGWGEIIGAVLLLVPRTSARGAWVLAGILVLAIFVHMLHGIFNVGNLIIYTASACVLATERTQGSSIE
jgi:hypothetical protein